MSDLHKSVVFSDDSIVSWLDLDVDGKLVVAVASSDNHSDYGSVGFAFNIIFTDLLDDLIEDYKFRSLGVSFPVLSYVQKPLIDAYLLELHKAIAKISAIQYCLPSQINTFCKEIEEEIKKFENE